MGGGGYLVHVGGRGHRTEVNERSGVFIYVGRRRAHRSERKEGKGASHLGEERKVDSSEWDSNDGVRNDIK